DGSVTVTTVTCALSCLARARPCSRAFVASSEPSVAIRICLYIDDLLTAASLNVRFAPKSGHYSWPFRKSALCHSRPNAPQQTEPACNAPFKGVAQGAGLSTILLGDERRAGRRRWMTRICVTWDVLLVLLNPPQDFTSCSAGARPGHPRCPCEQSQQIASLFDHLIQRGRGA